MMRRLLACIAVGVCVLFLGAVAPGRTSLSSRAADPAAGASQSGDQKESSESAKAKGDDAKAAEPQKPPKKKKGLLKWLFPRAEDEQDASQAPAAPTVQPVQAPVAPTAQPVQAPAAPGVQSSSVPGAPGVQAARSPAAPGVQSVQPPAAPAAQPGMTKATAMPAVSPAPSMSEAKAAVPKEEKKKKVKAAEQEPTPAAKSVRLPSSLERIQARLRKGLVGQDPTARAYLDLIDKNQASPSQLNDFAIYLARGGTFKDAEQYQRAAIAMDPKNPSLWINLGTLQHAAGDTGGAASSYKHAIGLDPNNAAAHYNLGAIYDERDEYDKAVEEFRTALTLDPDLGDPRDNPQAAVNERLPVVKLLNYQSQAGAMGLPLIPMQTPTPTSDPKKAPGSGTAEPKKDH